jgi:hypothetical protein
MKILSFDVGIKNLAHCYLDYDTPSILQWCNHELYHGNCKKGCSFTTITETLVCYLQEVFDPDFEADVVIIEQQPFKNGLIRTISIMIYTYFTLLKTQFSCIKKVMFINAQTKLKCRKAITMKPCTYYERKQVAIKTCREYINELFPLHLAFYDSQKKQDDLADCLLYCVYYIEMYVQNK